MQRAKRLSDLCLRCVCQVHWRLVRAELLSRHVHLIEPGLQLLLLRRREAEDVPVDQPLDRVQLIKDHLVLIRLARVQVLEEGRQEHRLKGVVASGHWLQLDDGAEDLEEVLGDVIVEVRDEELRSLLVEQLAEPWLTLQIEEVEALEQVREVESAVGLALDNSESAVVLPVEGRHLEAVLALARSVAQRLHGPAVRLVEGGLEPSW